MADPTGVADRGALRLDFDRRLMIQFRGSAITSDGGLLAYRELDDALALTASGGERLAEARTGKNRRHFLVGLLRQSVFGRLAGYEDVNDADRLCRDPTMRWVVGGAAPMGRAASASQMGRFETEWLVRSDNVAALADLPGQWIDAVHQRRQPKVIVLDMDSSDSPTYGEQEGSAYNGHLGCTCYHPLFVFNQLGDLERCALRPGNVHSADGWREVLEPVVSRYRCAVTIPASATRPVHGTSRDEWWPRSSGTPASFVRASASSSPTWRGRLSASLPSTTTAAPAASTSKKEGARSSGPACRAAPSLPTPSASSSTRWLIISAASCGRWRCRRPRSRGR